MIAFNVICTILGGQHKHNKKWECTASDINGKKKHLGLFENEKDAAQKYNEYICEHFPEFGKLNQID